MSREVYVRFCEGLGVQFPQDTRLICCFELESDARRYQTVLPKRLARYSLSVAQRRRSCSDSVASPGVIPNVVAEGIRELSTSWELLIIAGATAPES